MKESKRLAIGQIVSWNYSWYIAYRAGENCFLMQFNDYMAIYNNAMTAADVLSDDALLNRSIGVIGEIADSLEAYLGGFADKARIIATDNYIQEQRP